MDPLYAKAKGATGSSSKMKSSSRKKKAKRSARTQSAGQPTGRGETSGESTSETRSKRSSPALESSRGSKSSEPSKAAVISMNVMNVLDGAIGIALIVVGSLFLSQELEVMVVAITLGSVLLLGALCGAIGYFTSTCNRVGLDISMVCGALTFLAFIGVMIWAQVSWDSFLAFFDPDEAAIVDQKTLITVILSVLAVLELVGVIATRLVRKQMLKKDSGSSRSVSTRSTSSSTWNGILSWFGLYKKKRSDDFVMFDDNASMESALLWSKNGGQPSSDDYLEFVPEHERGLANYASNVALPLPPEDRVDY